MDESAEIPGFPREGATRNPKPTRQQKPGVIRRAVGGLVAAGGVAASVSILGSIRPADNPVTDTQDTKAGMTQTLAASAHDKTPIHYESFDKENIFDKVFHNLTIQEREKAQKIVREMEEVIRSNPSYEDMMKTVLDEKTDSGKPIKEIIGDTAQRYAIPEEIALGIAVIENGGGIDMISPGVGARGIFQLMPDTARSYGLTVDSKVDERADPVLNIDVGLRYLSDLKKRFGGDLGIAVWAYHAGEGNVYKALREYFIDTQNVDLGDIITDSYEEAVRISNDYSEAIMRHKLNINQLLSNGKVQQQVIAKLEDETELYPYKAIAAIDLILMRTIKNLVAEKNPGINP